MRFDRSYTNPASRVKSDFCDHFSDGEQISEFFQDGTFSEGPRLPTPTSFHCAVEVEPGFVFMSGNFVYGDDAKATFAFYPGNGTFDRLPDMTHGRSAHGCGVVKNGSS